MPRNASTPNARASDGKKRVASVRRKYKVDTKTKKKLLAGEIEHVSDMVLVLKLAGYNRTQISQTIGISRGQVAEFLDDEAAQAKLEKIRMALPAAALELLHGYMIEAVQTLMDIMRTSEDDATRLKAAESVLDRGGIPKASRKESVNENNNNETTRVELGTDFAELIRNASPEIQAQAADMIEGLETLLKTKAEEYDGDD